MNGDGNNLGILLSIWRPAVPVSAVITSEFESSRRRGMQDRHHFAMQRFRVIMDAVLSVIVLAAAKNSILENGASPLSNPFSVVSALAAVYWWIKIPETPRYAMDVLKDSARAATLKVLIGCAAV